MPLAISRPGGTSREGLAADIAIGISLNDLNVRTLLLHEWEVDGACWLLGSKLKGMYVYNRVHKYTQRILQKGILQDWVGFCFSAGISKTAMLLAYELIFGSTV